MLHAVLNMPVEIWRKDSAIDDMQRQSRYFEASKLIYQQADKIAELEKTIKRHTNPIEIEALKRIIKNDAEWEEMMSIKK
tara:strand:+ start:2988 stop:3227 length:240 start_codon:yes stop_codon:yes gene_type:complete